jgi:hypothetical protein
VRRVIRPSYVNFMYLIMKVKLDVFNLNSCLAVNLYTCSVSFQSHVNLKAIIVFVFARF